MIRVDVSHLGSEYLPAAEDVARTVVIQVSVQALLALVDSESGFFSPVFWLILAYVVVGTLAYHLLFRRLVVLV